MKDIVFYPKTKEAEFLVDKPVSSRLAAPEWLKNMPAFLENTFQVDDVGRAKVTAKMCLPFTDAFYSGYIQKTWCDIMIERSEDNSVQYRYSSSPVPIIHRDKTIDIPEGYHDIEFAWKVQWIPRLPKGYSVLYTHPLNREDLPFTTLSGIVDADRFHHETDGNHPVYIKKEFSGVIPAGTPMFQIIPFKRDDWKASYQEFSEKDSIQSMITRKYFHSGYRKMFWSKKTYL